MDIDDDNENEFLKIEEDGDDGLLLAEIIDGDCSENDTVNLEQFYIEAIVEEGNEEVNKDERKRKQRLKKIR